MILIGVGAFLLLLCFLLSVASTANDKFMKKYEKLLEKTTSTPFSVAMFFNAVNLKYLNNSIKVVGIDSIGGDFYNAKKKIIGLNKSGQTSLASFAVVAHELGHAYQDVVEKKLKSFNRARKCGMFIGKLFLPIVIATIVLLFFIENYFLVLIAGGATLLFIILLAIIIKTRTISIEKDASARGLELLSGMLSENEIKQCKKLLDSARMTYWADLIKLLFGWAGLTNKTKMFK